MPEALEADSVVRVENTAGFCKKRIRIRIQFVSWIRIRNQYAVPDPGGKNVKIKTEKITENL